MLIVRRKATHSDLKFPAEFRYANIGSFAGILVFLGFAYMMYVFGTPDGPPLPLKGYLPVGGLVCGGVFLFLDMLNAKLVIGEDYISTTNAFGITATILDKDVIGYKTKFWGDDLEVLLVATTGKISISARLSGWKAAVTEIDRRLDQIFRG